MLCTVEQVLAIPQLSNIYAIPPAWLNTLIGAATSAIQNYCKRDLLLTNYTLLEAEYQSGSTTRDIITRQYPIWTATTTIASAMDGVSVSSLSNGTIYVASTRGFPPGTGRDTSIQPAVIAVQTGISTYCTISYTGIDGPPINSNTPAFTGCNLAKDLSDNDPGILNSSSTTNKVFTPVIFFDPGGFGGQASTGFQQGSMMVLGSQFMVVNDKADRGGKKSYCGLIRKTGAQSSGFVGFYPENFYSGKLGAYRLPMFPRGDGNIELHYSAGYDPRYIPYDLSYAACMLVAQMARIQPTGVNLSGEGLGGFSYSVLMNPDNPDLGEIRRVLARYREVSW